MSAHDVLLVDVVLLLVGLAPVTELNLLAGGTWLGLGVG